MTLPLGPRDATWDAAAAAKTLDPADYPKAFFWSDPNGDAATLAAHKLGFAERVGGKLQANWAGVTAAAAAVMGARGGVQLPAGDVAGVKQRIAAYYTAARQKYGDDAIQPPWSKAVSVYETKSFPLELKNEPDAAGRFEGYLAVFSNVDQQMDVIEPGAFTKTIQDRGAKPWPLLWSHDPTRVLGTFTAAQDQKGLLIDAQLNLEVQEAKEKYNLLKQGALDGLSIGYRVVQKAYEGSVRRLREVGLKEGSLCVFPANELATVTGVKAGALLAYLQEEFKAGRVLSAQSIGAIQQALDAIETASETLEALLGLAEPDESTPQGEGAAGKADEPGFTTHLRDLVKSMKEVSRAS